MCRGGLDIITRYNRAKKSQQLWPVILDRLLKQSRQFAALYLLDRCNFSRESFQIAGLSVTKMGSSDLEALYPNSQICRDFYAGETLSRDFDWLADRWYVKTSNEVGAGVFELRNEEEVILIKSGPAPSPPGREEIAAGVLRESKSRAEKRKLASPVPILILSLYRPQFFEVPVVLLSDPGWRMLRQRFVRRKELPFGDPPSYVIEASHWLHFKEFVEISVSALETLREWPSFVIASRRYLAASFAAGDPLRMFDVEVHLDYMGLDFDNKSVLELAGHEDSVDRKERRGICLAPVRFRA